MASTVAQQILISPASFLLARATPIHVFSRASSVKRPPKPVRGTIKYRNLIESSCQSLKDRGFLRSQKPYSPPEDAADRVRAVLNVHNARPEEAIPRDKKFSILNNLFAEFNYAVPNSQLHKISTGDDLVVFYTTPITTSIPYDDLLSMSLPPNLHIQKEYVRFHPETDTKFEGVNAYPESPTVVTGLKSRKKYRGYSKELPQHYFNEAYTIDVELLRSRK